MIDLAAYHKLSYSELYDLISSNLHYLKWEKELYVTIAPVYDKVKQLMEIDYVLSLSEKEEYNERRKDIFTKCIVWPKDIDLLDEDEQKRIIKLNEIMIAQTDLLNKDLRIITPSGETVGLILARLFSFIFNKF